MCKLTNSLAILFLVLTAACGSGGGDSKHDKDKDKKDHEKKEQSDNEMKGKGKDKMKAMEKNGLKVYPINTKDFPDASLKLNMTGESKIDPGKVVFNFNVKNFELKSRTTDADKHGLAESSKGQHIHFIKNNGPYHAEYEPGFEKELEEGHHTILAFLSRSYHESVKNENAYVLKQLTVGEPSGKKADLSKPQLFYSRPKGTYKGKENFKKLLLDFYPVNVKELSKDGKKVRATINGTSFTFTDWKPYVIEGLKPGKVSVKIELLNKDGKLVDSKFNQVTREVTLKAKDGGEESM